jgi:hypothetical protein
MVSYIMVLPHLCILIIVRVRVNQLAVNFYCFFSVSTSESNNKERVIFKKSTHMIEYEIKSLLHSQNHR